MLNAKFLHCNTLKRFQDLFEDLHHELAEKRILFENFVLRISISASNSSQVIYKRNATIFHVKINYYHVIRRLICSIIVYHQFDKFKVLPSPHPQSEPCVLV